MWIPECAHDGILKLVKKVIVPKRRQANIQLAWNYEVSKFSPGTPKGLSGEELFRGAGTHWDLLEVIKSKNLVVNVGLDEALKLITGESTDVYNNTNSYIGAGNSATAAAAGQTGLQGGSTHWEAMDVSYPAAVASQQVEFRATFESADAQFAWEELALASGNNPPTTGIMMSRTVKSFGTKPAAAWVAKVFLNASAS